MNVTLVTNIPTPYRAPLYSRVDDRLRERGGRLTVIYGAPSQSDRQWSGAAPTGTARSFLLRRGQVVVGGRSTYVNPGVVRVVARSEPDVVVLSGYAPWSYAVVVWCRLRAVPLVLWSGETHSSARARGQHAWPRVPILRGTDAFLAYGPPAGEYLMSLGAPPASITVLGNGIDVDGFATAVDAARAAPPPTHLDGLGHGVVLSVGGKGVELVAEAARLVDPPPPVVVAGRDVDLPGVVGLGRRSPGEMPAIYAAARCVVHLPPYDQWPHAINEALAAGLPVVAAPDNGLPDDVFTGPGSALVEREPHQVAAAIRRALAVAEDTSPERREATRAPLRRWGVPAMAKRFVAVAEAVSRRRRARPSTARSGAA